MLSRQRALSRLYYLAVLFSLFQRSIPEEESAGEFIAADEEAADFGRIRCPLCKWRPKASSLWYCGDCWHPERFMDGCGMEWNTFDTRGLCPGCGHQWRWTSCLSCWEWTLHEDWYAGEDEGNGSR